MDRSLDEIKALDDELAGRSYPEIESALMHVSPSILAALLDSRSGKIGDTAADLLRVRNQADAVVQAVLSKQISTSIGKKRALYVLQGFGKNCAGAEDAYLILLHDANADVVDWALFGLVFLQNPEHIAEIEAVMQKAFFDSRVYRRCRLAVEALQRADPFIFAPGYRDDQNRWGLDKERFGNKVGL